VDIFVCTADPGIEPPVMVINTVLSLMAYDYPPHKLSVYLSDDAASDITFYALLEASIFAKQWLPFCRNLKVDPTSPAAYFKTIHSSTHPNAHANELVIIKVTSFLLFYLLFYNFFSVKIVLKSSVFTSSLGLL